THLPPRRGGMGLPATFVPNQAAGNHRLLLEAAGDGGSALHVRKQVPSAAGLLLLADPGLELAAREPVSADLLALAGLDGRGSLLCRRRFRLSILRRNSRRGESQRGGEGERSQDAAHEVVSRSECRIRR